MEYREFLAFGAAHTRWWYLGKAVHIRFESWLFASVAPRRNNSNVSSGPPPAASERKSLRRQVGHRLRLRQFLRRQPLALRKEESLRQRRLLGTMRPRYKQLSMSCWRQLTIPALSPGPEMVLRWPLTRVDTNRLKMTRSSSAHVREPK